ncbi:hypothetical protein NDU88_001951 [Pleurodeles waltl]|uniref:Uncharacterized protein n=1 Tax=Pleurodeles waltl TaxID=8319 RepID=A0AAV7TJV2_PLEWA|nr:hypothetical protein NDU88_001951 [Pleurodeles waltl]
MSQGYRRCDGIGSLQTLDLRHSSVSKVEWDQWLRQREAYRVVGLLQCPGPRAGGIGLFRGSGICSQGHRIRCTQRGPQPQGKLHRSSG